MEIWKTLNRFFSIFLIVALGVAFFAGLRASNPDMRLTADYYYDNSELMDIRVLSTLGLTQEDVTAITQVEGVEKAEPAYSTNVLCTAGNSELVLQVLSLTTQINKYTLTKGRLPQKTDEVMVDSRFIDSTGMKIGDKIKVTSGSEKDLSETLSQDQFTIVGIGKTPYFLSFQRGSTDIGNGKVNSFIVTVPEAFTLKAFTTIYVNVQGAKEMTVYTDEYDNCINQVINKIKSIAEVRCQSRYDELYLPAKDKIMQSQKELDDKKATAEADIQDQLTKLQLAGLEDSQLQAKKKEVEAGKAAAEEKFAEAQADIDTAQGDLDQLEVPIWYVLDRGSVDAYVEFEQNADRIGAVGEVFPAIFFLVAALISLTTMTRMVEEERTQIGTLKALGYSKKAIAMKYLLYALLATLGGSLFGAAVGLKVLPTVIITAYKIMYPGIPKVVTPFNTYYASLATILAVLTVSIATYLACYKELLSKPAQLMRPEAPRIGKRVLLERIPFIWKRLNFTWKATIRNLLRYKKRFFMTIFGIGGCMALLLVGFGLKDSIFVVYTRQFSEIMLYDASISLDSKATESQKDELETAISEDKNIDTSLDVRNSAVDISHDGIKKSISMYVPKDEKKIEDLIVFRDRVSHKSYDLTEEGVILTEHIAKMLGVKAGDKIQITEGDITVEAKITAIAENYLAHYLYISPTLYQNLFGKEVKYNEIFLGMKDASDDKEQLVVNNLLRKPAASGVFYISYFRNLLSNIMVSLNVVVWVLIISAGALAFVVLYNLNNININERKRELATIKVLGFYNNEMAAYVYRENIILTFIGILFGIVLGIILHHYVIMTVEIELVMFGRNIDPSSFVYSILLTFLFSAIVNFLMFFKLKKIDMVESLKSVE